MNPSAFFVVNDAWELAGRFVQFVEYGVACQSALALACANASTYRVVSRQDGEVEWSETVPLVYHLTISAGVQP